MSAAAMRLPTADRYPGVRPRPSRLPTIPNAGPVMETTQYRSVSAAITGSHWDGAAPNGSSASGGPEPCALK